MKMNKIIYVAVLFFIGLILPMKHSFALTVGETYTVSIEKINTDGTLTSDATSLELATTATADSDGKISFSFTGNLPNNTSCNFMVVTLKNSSDAVVRQTVAPCPDKGGTLPLGISGVTNNQASALLAAFAAAKTDDPIVAVFGFTIVRSEGISAAELTFMATLVQKGISGTSGFVADMTSKGVTTAQLATYRKAVVSKLADPDTGYSKLMKDSVDVSSVGDSTLEAAKRGEASGKLLSFLVTAATTAGFSQDRILEAFNAMGAVVVPLMATAIADGNLTAATKQAIDSSVGGGIQKLKADRGIEVYTQALSTLGATGADLASFTTAATTLTTTMSTAFQVFDKVFTGSETKSEVETANTVMNNTMNTAFSAFINSTSASNARITTMISNIDTALGSSSGLSVSNFKFFTSDGTSTNWPIMMVIPTDYASSIKTAGGNMSYTRDTVAIPAGMSGFLAARTDFSATPYPYRALFEIQEDVMIREFVRFGSQQSAGQDMSAQNTLEKAFSDSLVTIAGNITGTTNGSTALSSTVKAAFVELVKSPQF